MPPFKDEHILIIAPGSQTTLAQLGLPESFTPAKWRFPTRMFPGETPGEWEPLKVREKIITTFNNGAPNGHPPPQVADVEMQDVPNADATKTEPEGDTTQAPEESSTTTTIYEEDPTSVEGAVFPLIEGRIQNWSCFLALLTHIYNTLSPPFHTPVLVISQPCWSARDHEIVTQFFFENFKMPAFCLMDSALASCYAYGVPTATVIDVGYEKCDVTAVSDFVVCDTGRAVAVPGCGGQDMTRRLFQVLGKKGLNEKMCEQLKRSGVCEILPAGTSMPGKPQEGAEVANPAAEASTGATASGQDAKEADGSKPGQAPRGPGVGTEVGEEGVVVNGTTNGNGEEEENDGVLDVASIVAKGNASEFLAKREKEKAEKAAAKKGADLANKAARMKNSERQKATFTFEEYVPIETATAVTTGTKPVRKRKREIEVGTERFMAASPPPGTNSGILDTIAAIIHSTILSVPEVSQRSGLWENLIILGNGSRIRGFTTALLSTLSAKYTLSPSTATIFTSELPSNFSTPLPTNGTNTPVPGGPGAHAMHNPAGHGVNPLLVAATKHANQQIQMQQQPPFSQNLQVPGPSLPDQQSHSQHRAGQTPTSVKTVKAPEYFPEWKDMGVEEMGFLGAQVAAKVVFVVDQGLSKGFLTRGEYNELGPAGVHDCAM